MTKTDLYIFRILLACALVPAGCSPAKPKTEGALFERAGDEEKILTQLKQIREKWGTAGKQEFYNRKVMKNGTVVMQYSSEKRLYDHNIFLRGLFDGCFTHASGNLQTLFRKPVLLDIGSAILFQNGAPTVRDLQEDGKVYDRLGALVASDINDTRSPDTRFIELYRKKNNLPFPVVEIPMLLNQPAQITDLLNRAGAGPAGGAEKSSVILRASHSGPDLFYSRQEQQAHLRAVVQGLHDRNVLYLFERFLLFHAAGSDHFEWVGIFDGAGYAFIGIPWTRINWNTRKLSQSFHPDPRYLKVTCEKT